MINDATRHFISLHRNDDVRMLALKGAANDVDMPMALQQIQGWQTARTKLPSWAECAGIVFPPHLSMEQCSSELTARYKASLIAERLKAREETAAHTSSRDGYSVVDLTGGFGIDFFFIAQACEGIYPGCGAVYVEQQSHLCTMAEHNFRALALEAEVKNCDSIAFLQNMPHAHVVMVDPARRSSSGAKVVMLGDCAPNILEICKLMLSKAHMVVVKLSPMLDWHLAVEQINEAAGRAVVSEVHVVAVKNECKELLMVMQGQHDGTPPTMTCANHDGAGWQLMSYRQNETAVLTTIADVTGTVGSVLLEPNAAVMKAGCFALLCERYGVRTLATNSHLFIAAGGEGGGILPWHHFPGRALRIVAVSKMNKRELGEALKGIDRANVAVRNFPMGADALRKKLRLKDGGTTFVYGTTAMVKGKQANIVIVAEQMAR
jgi:hypothetical protein